MRHPGRMSLRLAGLGLGLALSPVSIAAQSIQTDYDRSYDFSQLKAYDFAAQVRAHVVASSARADVALLQLDRTPIAISPARLGDSDKLDVGDQIVVIGAPYGLGHTLTVGHVSGRLAVGGIVSGVPMEVLQTDAAINVGNSGGPMFNMEGEVVGIVSRILSQSGGFEGVGFAVPANVAQKVLLTARSFWTGMDGILLQDTLARIFNLPQPAGLLVQQVAAGSPAAALGLRPSTWRATIGTEQLLVGGDIILDVAGIAVAPNGASFDQMQGMLSKLRPGDSVTAKVLRGGKVLPLSAVRPR